MNKIIVAFAITGILINAYFGLFPREEVDILGVIEKGVEGEEGQGLFSVVVPERKMGEIARYYNGVFAQIYWENKTDGSWEKYTLGANGTVTFKINRAVKQKEDGFGKRHSTFSKYASPSGKFTLCVEGSDSEPATVHGNYRAERHEYVDLNKSKVVQIITEGEIKVTDSEVPLEFEGGIRSYPNPNLAKKKTLGMRIYGEEKELRVGDAGNITIKPKGSYHSGRSITYHWVVEKGTNISGHQTLKINITATFFEEPFLFNQQIWISNDVAVPVKIRTRTNDSWNDENSTGSMVLEIQRELKRYEGGEKQIPWGECEGEHWAQKDADGEYSTWKENYMPTSGSGYEDSSFEFKPEDAVEYALKNDYELQEFLNEHPDAVIIHASYNVTDEKLGDAGTYTWNLTFGHKAKRESMWKKKNWKHAYNVLVECKKSLFGNEEIRIVKDESQGRCNGTAVLSKSEMKIFLLTLASSEELLKKDEEVKEEVDDEKTSESDIDFSEKPSTDGKLDTTYHYLVGGLSLYALPALDIVETLVDFSFPTSNCTWVVQKGTLRENGKTFAAGVDAETGQLLFVANIEGTVVMGFWR